MTHLNNAYICIYTLEVYSPLLDSYSKVIYTSLIIILRKAFTYAGQFRYYLFQEEKRGKL